MNLQTRLKSLRKALGLSQKEFASLCGWHGENPSMRISNYEQGKREPSLSEIDKMAEVLKTTPAWLMFGIGDNPKPLNMSDKKTEKDFLLEGKIPILSCSDLVNIFINRKDFNRETTNYLENPFDTTRNLFAFQIEDTSMFGLHAYPKPYVPGEIIIIDKEQTPFTGDLVVVINNNQVIFRKLINDGSNMLLVAANDSYPPIPYDPVNTIFCGVTISSIFENKKK